MKRFPRSNMVFYGVSYSVGVFTLEHCIAVM